ncbi:hypothetical protein GON26_01170 [Flavobacterium sp. GA093]|uniref:Uncharacterized protein n=1 Tax=Flavobacterium hydrocarbonoxydans TaxID=2683249 RepID=A0A6I4NEK4_9FLAO|nr:hypothetical protein [Flavobacterium hydrocarbonoxydans]MWB92960.1 hypothetical protein [Flavobacterium hydrocarbonoxydans]
MEYLKILIIQIIIIIGAFMTAWYCAISLTKKRKRKSKPIKKLQDLYFFECELEMLAMGNYSITEVCPHNIAEIKVLEATCGCEKTVIVCSDCRKELSEPKTDC